MPAGEDSMALGVRRTQGFLGLLHARENAPGRSFWMFVAGPFPFFRKKFTDFRILRKHRLPNSLNIVFRPLVERLHRLMR